MVFAISATPLIFPLFCVNISSICFSSLSTGECVWAVANSHADSVMIIVLSIFGIIVIMG